MTLRSLPLFVPKTIETIAILALFASGVLAQDSKSPSVTPPVFHKIDFLRTPTLPPTRQKFPSESATRELGKILFNDPRLSHSGKLSCQSCHMPEFGWVDGKPRSIEQGSRRSMPLWNLAWDNRFTWSGRAGSIASQSILAATAQLGMNSDLESASRVYAADPKLAQLFYKAFGKATASKKIIEPGHMALALEMYVRSLVSPATRFDKWIATGIGLNLTEQKGFELFIGKGNCATCHSSWRFSDSDLHDIGLDEEPGAGAWLDGGLYKMKTPGLREVSKRVFFMHNGRFSDLAQVVNYYNVGGFFKRPSNELKPLGLSAPEVEALTAFLKTL